MTSTKTLSQALEKRQISLQTLMPITPAIVYDDFDETFGGCAMSEEQFSAESNTQGTPDTIQLINVMVVREGESVSSRWGIHPQLKRDLNPTEWQELTQHMNRVVTIVGSKFVEQLSRNEGNIPGQGSA